MFRSVCIKISTATAATAFKFWFGLFLSTINSYERGENKGAERKKNKRERKRNRGDKRKEKETERKEKKKIFHAEKKRKKHIESKENEGKIT